MIETLPLDGMMLARSKLARLEDARGRGEGGGRGLGEAQRSPPPPKVA